MPRAGAEFLAAAAENALDALRQAHRLRELHPSGAPGVDLTHNDYLALRDDAEHQTRLRRGLVDLPASAGASRLLGGEHPVFAALEGEFAVFKRAPAALYFASGYAANEGLMTALAQLPGTAFFSDALNHASLIDGLRLAALGPERKQIFRHNDCAHLQTLLAASTAPVNIIVTETVFSMDGDRAPVAELAALAAQYRGILLLDEAHAIFALGDEGRGLAPDGAITVNTCGKALAAQGALVAGPAWLRPWLVNKARPFIYSTGPSPWLAQALRLTLEQRADFAAKRAHLSLVSALVRGELRQRGLDILGSTTHIIPVLVGDDRAAMQASAKLAEQGYLVRAVRPPTVAEGSARLRLSMNAGLSLADAQRLAAAVATSL